jgi:hypothetical protein
VRDVALRSDRTAPSMRSMRDGGKTTKEMEREELYFLTETSMMATGRKIINMGLASSATKMGPDTMDNGKITRSTVRALRPSLMVLVTMVATWRTRNMDRVNLNGAMAALTREAFTRINIRAKVSMMTPESLFNRHLSDGWSFLRW